MEKTRAGETTTLSVSVTPDKEIYVPGLAEVIAAFLSEKGYNGAVTTEGGYVATWRGH